MSIQEEARKNPISVAELKLEKLTLNESSTSLSSHQSINSNIDRQSVQSHSKSPSVSKPNSIYNDNNSHNNNNNNAPLYANLEPNRSTSSLNNNNNNEYSLNQSYTLPEIQTNEPLFDNNDMNNEYYNNDSNDNNNNAINPPSTQQQQNYNPSMPLQRGSSLINRDHQLKNDTINNNHPNINNPINSNNISNNNIDNQNDNINNYNNPVQMMSPMNNFPGPYRPRPSPPSQQQPPYNQNYSPMIQNQLPPHHLQQPQQLMNNNPSYYPPGSMGPPRPGFNPSPRPGFAPSPRPGFIPSPRPNYATTPPQPGYAPSPYMRPMGPPQGSYGMAPPPPPPQHTNNMIDNNYMPDSSVYAASQAGKKMNQSPYPPPSMENLQQFRAEAMQSQNPKKMLDLAKYMMEVMEVACAKANGSDPKRAKKIRETMTLEAQKIVKKLASNSGMGKTGFGDAQFYLADSYGSGKLGLPVDQDKAFSLYLQGSKLNHPACTYRVAICYEAGAGTKKDNGHAIQFLKKAAHLGEVRAMHRLAMILLRGNSGQSKNPREGISWLERAATQADEDYPQPIHDLGVAYEKEGIPSVIPDVNYARDLFTTASQYGYAPSQFKLGLAYENGFLNCPIDPRRSIAWYSKAAEQGDIESELALSGWYLTGADGVLQQSDSEAYLWARKAADKGSAKAEYAVGYYTETGVGVSPNLQEAKKWYMRAAAQNNRRAMLRLTELKKHGNIQQRKNHTRPTGGGRDEKDSDCSIM